MKLLQNISCKTQIVLGTYLAKALKGNTEQISRKRKELLRCNKGYLNHKTIFCHKIAIDMQFINVFM